MRKTLFVIALAIAMTGTFATGSKADEGMWPVFELDQLNFDSLKALGLQLGATQIYNANGNGLCGAVVQVGGGSGAFVSPHGLIVTNHHVAFGAIQSQSTAEHNYIEQGFLARSQAEEIPAIGYNCYVAKSFVDVTAKVLKAVSNKMSDLERYKAVEKRTKELVAQAEKGRDVKCEIATFDGGRQYVLITNFKIQDIRIVAVPPQGLGNFGGEIDNWMWPRHTGDYSFLRAYVAPDGKSAEYSKSNVPYGSPVYLPVSASHLGEGDFAMAIGYPGRTDRYASSFAIDDAVNFYYPTSIRYRRALIGIMEDAGKADPQVAVRVSSRIKGLANYLKNYEGMLAGLSKGRLLEKRVEQEKALAAGIKGQPALQAKYGGTLTALRDLYQRRSTYRQKQTIVQWMSQASQFYRFATQLYRWSLEKTKADMDREPAYMERNLPSMRRGLRESQVNLVPDVDRRMLAYVLRQTLSLPNVQRLTPLDRLISDTTKNGADAAIAAFVDRLYADTKLGTLDDRMKMFDMSKQELLAQNDAFIGLAVSLYDELEKMRDADKAFDGAMKRLNPELISAYRELKMGPRYPDANGTMRLTYGIVQGYAPADAVAYSCFTTLKGVAQKETGADPFNSPKALLEASRKGDLGRYADPSLGDVPVDFLTNDDTTGGNSGSPIINGRGDLIGLCFDGNYEAIAADYQFDPRVTRTINVDSRYILFTLDKVMGATELLGELTVH